MGVEIIALGPDGPNAFKHYWEENELPFTGCSDIRSRVADTFYQEVNLFKFGRMPALFIIDRAGNVRYQHYGDSMSDIPENETVLKLIEEIRDEQQQSLTGKMGKTV
jgi:peroxiredoxin